MDIFQKRPRPSTIVKKGVALDEDTWLRAKAWALWKTTFELCNTKDKTSNPDLEHIKIVREVLTHV